MDITTFKSLSSKNPETFYCKTSVSNLLFDDEYVRLLDSPSYGDVLITPTMRESLCRYVGMPSSINKDLYSSDKELWAKVLTRLYESHNLDDIILTLSYYDDDKCKVKSVCNVSGKEPLLSDEFINQVLRYFDNDSNVLVYDISYHQDANVSTITLLFNNEESCEYDTGVVLINDETYGSSCRMCIKFPGSEIYILPSKVYNLTSTRYSKNCENSREALDILMLRIKDDYQNGIFDSKHDLIEERLRQSKNECLSYNEFSRVKVQLLNMCRSSEMSEEEIQIIEDKLAEADDYESLYGKIDSNYLWSCTALGSMNLDRFLSIIDKITQDHKFYQEDLLSYRDLLGEYLMIPRLCRSIAHK